MRRSQRSVWRRKPADAEGRIPPWVGKALAAKLRVAYLDVKMFPLFVPEIIIVFFHTTRATAMTLSVAP